MSIEYQVLTEEQQQQSQIARLQQLESEHYSVTLRLGELDAIINELEGVQNPNDVQTAALGGYKAEQERLLLSQKDLEITIQTNQTQVTPILEAQKSKSEEGVSG